VRPPGIIERVGLCRANAAPAEPGDKENGMSSNAPSVLDRPTLVLNRNWYPILTTSTREAIGLVCCGAARIVDPVTFEVHDLDSWDAVSRAGRHIHRGRIRSMRLCIAPPEVVVLTRYQGAGKRAIVFSRRNLYRRDRNACQYCGRRPGTRSLTIDHVLPRSRGGRSTWDNCVLACIPCNSRKGARTPSEAGMKPIRPPRKPRWSPDYGVPAGERCESWSHFISRAYWDTELTP
jgi:5-methylcytosine-specific restriction endonuclease McrA